MLQNGGTVRNEYFNEDISPSEVFSILTNFSEELWDSTIQALDQWLDRRGDFEDNPELQPELERRFGDLSKLIVLYTDGHVFNLLDYREKPEDPPVVYLDLEAGDGSLAMIAPSVEELFLKPSI